MILSMPLVRSYLAPRTGVTTKRWVRSKATLKMTKLKMQKEMATARMRATVTATSKATAMEKATEKRGDGEGEGEGEGNADGEGVREKPKEHTENAAREHLMKQAHSIILPSYSTWFDMTVIHPIERKSLPEFFNHRNRSKTPAVYKDYRDFMVNTLPSQPDRVPDRNGLSEEPCWGRVRHHAGPCVP